MKREKESGMSSFGGPCNFLFRFETVNDDAHFVFESRSFQALAPRYVKNFISLKFPYEVYVRQSQSSEEIVYENLTV